MYDVEVVSITQSSPLPSSSHPLTPTRTPPPQKTGSAEGAGRGDGDAQRGPQAPRRPPPAAPRGVHGRCVRGIFGGVWGLVVGTRVGGMGLEMYVGVNSGVDALSPTIDSATYSSTSDRVDHIYTPTPHQSTTKNRLRADHAEAQGDVPDDHPRRRRGGA